jgi:hypothetical protein
MTYLFSLLGFVLGMAPVPHPSPPPTIPAADTLRVWNITADRISADPLGQYYILSAGTLIKYDTRGDSAYSWSEPQTGRITFTDTGDPMRILVYQKDFNLVRFLNNRLAPISAPIGLDNLGITIPLALAVSRQGGFWVVDGSSLRLKHIGPQLETLVESGPLNLTVEAGSPELRMAESGDQVLLLIPGKEIQVFDLFANFIKKIPLKIPAFQPYGDRILLVYPDRITLWKDPVSPEEVMLNHSGAGFREACLNGNKLLIRSADKVFLIKR